MKTIISIYRKLNINFFTYIFILLLFLIGLYKEFLVVSSLVLIHETGHILAAKHFKWNIKEVSIFPYGGCVKFDEDLNKALYEEFIIMISGPLFQVLYYLLMCILYRKGIVNEHNFLLLKEYHYTLLSFNLLPIYPLDGGKLLNIFFNYIMPFKKGNIITVIISFIFLIINFLIFKSINYVLMCSLIVTELIVFFKRQNYLYNRLLLERYLKVFKFKKIKVINNKNNIYKEKNHVIKINDEYITEKEFLKKRYERK